MQSSHSNMKTTSKRPATTMQTPLKPSTKKLDTADKRPGTTPQRRHRPKQLSTSMLGATATATHHKHHHAEDLKPVELSSPTSISMKNSYIIKNADSSFETYYNSMRKRTKNYQMLNQSALGGQNINLQPDAAQVVGIVAGKRPQARDGHSGVVLGDSFLVFGGDRHQMPYNDMFMLDMKRLSSLQH